ncbi:Beta-glucuronosyltransferase GlcAT14A [Vigna angularis]|uniref:Beta-glucuronosyltransferase GlcAT14A n=1 Tax=Phaseolus angularis TaxID=3914 RepID=A0A8T0K582_PHAAN|nr:Beta-glucuronosyltransferase GlcAT14A [Vigna angularis]
MHYSNETCALEFAASWNQRARPIIIDHALYLSKKSDLALTTQRRTLPTSFKLFSGVDVSGEKKCSCNYSNVINQNTLTSIGLVNTTKGWCFKDEENMVQSSGSTPTLNEDRTNFVPETNFERFVVEKLRRIEQRIDTLHEKKNKNDSPTEDSSEESSEEDSMEIF